MDNADTLGVLRQLERGEISAAQADEWLSEPSAIERDHAPGIEETSAPKWVRRLWFYPLIAGLLIVGLGVWIIIATVHANILWFLFGLPILLLGTLIVAVAAGAESGHWLYVNVNEGGKRRHNIRFGIPFPLGLLRGGLRIAGLFGQHPRMKINVHSHSVKFDAWTEADAFVTALERELAQGRGVTVDVNDKDERIQVYIV
ncbi:MAG: hypothetical protein HY782_23625 [Chloroflexi bacterium]|nr:hypothetical protein [Chloroflexota bacterium]